MDPHQNGFVGKGSDHLQLVRILAVPRPREGVCGGAKFFGSALLQLACSVCVSERFFFSFHLSLCLSVCLSVCLSICLLLNNY